MTFNKKLHDPKIQILLEPMTVVKLFNQLNTNISMDPRLVLPPLLVNQVRFNLQACEDEIIWKK